MDGNATVSYKNNVNILFSYFTSHASLTGYYNTSVGDDQDKVYGYYMCRGDATPQVCNDCILNTTRFAQEADCEYVDGISYSEMCMFRYANHSMYGVWQEGIVVTVSSTGKQEVKTQQYNKTFDNTMEALIDKSTYGCASPKENRCVPGFGTKEANVTQEETIYSLAQCTPDIVGVNCSKCLHYALIGLQSYRGYQGASIYKPNCRLMYDNTSFYDLQKVTPSKGDGSRFSPNYVHLYVAMFLLVVGFV
ncbi:hypothetical protein vseg_011510 [Gypsophila vaccaria]